MKHWDEILGKRLRSYRGADVPGQADDLWANIDAALGAPAALPVPLWKRPPFRLALAAAVAAVVAIGLTVRQAPEAAFPAPTLDIQPTDIEGTPINRTTPVEVAAETATSGTSETSTAATESTTSIEAATAVESTAAIATATGTESTATIETATGTESTTSVEAATAIESTAGIEAATATVPTANVEAVKATETTAAVGSTAPTNSEVAPPRPTGNNSNAASVPALADSPIASSGESDDKATSPLRRLALRGTPGFPSTWSAPLLFHSFEDISEPTTFAIRAFAGPTWSHFSVTDNPEQSAHFHADYSAGGGLMFEFDGAQTWSIGLSWTDYVHNLQYTETTENAIAAPGVVSVVIDISTGDTLSINEGMVAGVEERRRYVDHHNRFQAFSIPLEWRGVRSLGNLQYGLGLGAALQIRSGASGSIINNTGQAVGYSDNNLSRGRLAVVPTARLFAGLRFAPSWRLDLGIAAGMQRHVSRSADDLPASSQPSWQGRMAHGQVQIGLSRFFSKRRNAQAD
ncbi:hypothetical protein OAO65_03330 [Flavobacteriales bacterium]|nr:hypothetical protein [Flavobacteriales bacterium]